MHLVCLHNVIPDEPDAFDRKCSRISVDEFERFLDDLPRHGLRLVSYSEYEALLRDGCTDPDVVALSFDDGFLGVHDNAAPVLAARGTDAVAFIVPPFLGNPPDRIFHFLETEIAFRLSTRETLRLSYWDETFDLTITKSRIAAMKRVKKLLKTRPEADRVTGRAEMLEKLGVSHAEILGYAHRPGENTARFSVMAPRHLQALHDQGWTIGAHSMTHRTLSMLSDAELETEIGTAAEFFAQHFGWTALPFAYPYGDIVHVGPRPPLAVAAAGHPLAFTTVPGPSDLAAAPHLLPRVDYKVFLRDHALLDTA